MHFSLREIAFLWKGPRNGIDWTRGTNTPRHLKAVLLPRILDELDRKNLQKVRE